MQSNSEVELSADDVVDSFVRQLGDHAREIAVLEATNKLLQRENANLKAALDQTREDVPE